VCSAYVRVCMYVSMLVSALAVTMWIFEQMCVYTSIHISVRAVSMHVEI